MFRRSIILALLCLVVISINDFDLTWMFTGSKLGTWTSYFDRSLFEGEGVGVGDLPILLLIAAFLYCLHHDLLEPKETLTKERLAAGFVLFSGLSTSLIVHFLKWTMARARPFEVLHEPYLAYSAWYEWGAFADQIVGYSGSFISGHTASVAALFCICSVLWLFKVRPIYNLATGILVFSLAALMGLSRVVDEQHWVTDVLASLFLVPTWILIVHGTIIRIPDQLKHMSQDGYRLPKLWELRLLGWGLLGAGFLSLPIIGGKLIVKGDPLTGGLVAVGGVLLCIVGLRRLVTRCRPPLPRGEDAS